MSEQKTYASIKKVSLEGLSEGYDESCYAYVVPATFRTRKDIIAGFDSDSDDAQIEVQEKLVREHFVSGRIKAFDGQQFVEQDLTVDTAVAVPDISNALVNQIMGWDFDPKDIGKAVAPSALPENESQATETPSSEG